MPDSQNEALEVTLSIILPIASKASLEKVFPFVQQLELSESVEVVCMSSIHDPFLLSESHKNSSFYFKVDEPKDIQFLTKEGIYAARADKKLVLPPSAPELWEEILNSYLENPLENLSIYQPRIKNFSLIRKFVEKLTFKKIALDAGVFLTNQDQNLFSDAIESECFSLNYALPSKAAQRISLKTELSAPKKKRVYLEESYRATLGRFLPFSFLLYCIVAGSGVVVNLGTLQVGKFSGLTDQIALIVAIEISMITNFVLHNLLTFSKNKLKGTALFVGFIKFQLINLVGGGINYSVGMTVREQFGFHIILSGFIGILLAMIWNYNFNKKITWKSDS